jgi:hypothetical protein
VRFTTDVDDNFVFLVGELIFISGAADIFTEGAIEGVLAFLHPEVRTEFKYINYSEQLSHPY